MPAVARARCEHRGLVGGHELDVLGFFSGAKEPLVHEHAAHFRETRELRFGRSHAFCVSSFELEREPSGVAFVAAHFAIFRANAFAAEVCEDDALAFVQKFFPAARH